MFSEKVFECYTLEINILSNQRQLLGILFQDLAAEEEKLLQIKHLKDVKASFHLDLFIEKLTGQNSTKKYYLFSNDLAKLVMNINQ